MRQPARKRPAAGFTLVEILVVIVIIALLASLLTAAVFSALVAAGNARIAVEVNNLSQGIEAFKNTYGYPPDCSDPDKVTAFLARNFRYRDAATDILDVNGNSTDDLTEDIIDPDEALVLWLQGFSPDDYHPLWGEGDRTPYFDFDPGRLKDLDDDGYLSYLPPGDLTAPYVYFDSRTYEEFVDDGGYTPPGAHGVVVPYLTKLNTPYEFAAAGRYQIISAGRDDRYSGLSSPETERLYPTGTNYAKEDLDNITSFYEGTLENAIP